MTQAEICKALAIAAWHDFMPEGDRESYYNTYNDPCLIASTMGAKGTYVVNPDPENNSDVRLYTFRDNSIAYVILNEDGTGCGIDGEGP